MIFEFPVPTVPEAHLYSILPKVGLLYFLVEFMSQSIFHITPIPGHNVLQSALQLTALESDYLDLNPGTNTYYPEQAA